MSSDGDRVRLMITSVGSLVGQNILEGLSDRRDLCDVVGLNSQAQAVSNFLCDRVYLMPDLQRQDEFASVFQQVLAKESPHLVLPGRDDDVVFLAEWGARHPQDAARLMVGDASCALRLRDKRQTWTLAEQHALPFAPTLTADDGIHAVRDLVQDWGWPLVAKPRRGNASRGVVVVGSWPELERVLGWPDYCLQPWLGRKPDLDAFERMREGGVPLDWSLPGIQKFSLDGCIGADGRLLAPFASLHAEVRLGRSEHVQALPLEGEVAALLQGYGKALAAEGWRGPFNVQLGRSRDDRLMAFEINGRFTGSAATLSWLGLDYLGECIAAFVPSPELARPARSHASSVDKRLTNWALHRADVQCLQQTRFWSRA